MHIPDGYLSPLTVGVSYAIALPLWAIGFKKLKEKLNEETLPLIGALSALSFIVMMLNIPLPGGTSGHVVGAVLISLLLDPWIAFISVSLVLLIQAIIFGDGGISTYAVNSLSMAFVASFVGRAIYERFKDFKYAPFLAGWIGLVSSAVFISFVLGIQPIFWVENGKPLYFPFDLKTTFIAMVGSHLLFFGIVEGIFTQLLFNYFKEKKNETLQTL